MQVGHDIQSHVEDANAGVAVHGLVEHCKLEVNDLSFFKFGVISYFHSYGLISVDRRKTELHRGEGPEAPKIVCDREPLAAPQLNLDICAIVPADIPE